MTALPLPIETERLVLRPFEAKDKALEMTIHDDSSRFVHLPIDPRPESKIDEYVAARLQADSFDDTGVTIAIVIETKGGDYVGSLQLTSLETEPLQVEIGWMALTDQQGKGYISEAVQGTIDMAFSRLALHRVVARIIEGNNASVRLAERVGFRQEAHFVKGVTVDGDWRDEFVYSMLQEDWQAADGSS